MPSKLTGTVRNIEVSMDNIKSWVESGLRQMKEIKDSESVKITFSTVSDHTTVVEWEARQTVPLQIQQEKGVQVTYF